MITISEIQDKTQKQNISLKIMNALPKWFNPPDDIDKKSIMHMEYPFFTVYDEDTPIGFLALKIHNEYTAEIFNMGILENHHRNGTGSELVNYVQKYCIDKGFTFLTVKTLDSSAIYEPYNQTRNFYRKLGFIPLEVFTTYWDEKNPCLFLAKHLEK